MKLRPYQTSIIDEARSLMQQGQRSLLICAPTGSGKTALTASMLGTAASKMNRSWFIVHRRELVKQSILAFDKATVRHGVIANGFHPDPRPLVQVCTIGTLQNRYHRQKPPRLIVWDECHHLGARTWERIFKAFPHSFHIGLTATPVRMDGKGLGEYFSHIVQGPSVKWLIDNGYLSDYKLYAPAQPDLSSTHTRMGDFIKSEILDIMDRPTITGSAINEYAKRAHGKRGIVFSISVEHSKNVVKQFNNMGIRAEHVDGGTDQGERDKSIERFRRGETLILSNVDLFGEGFDLPAAEVDILLRPTQSLALYLQQVGRVLRPAPGKPGAIILDHASNAMRHGLPDDEREWSLDGIERRAKKQDGEVTIKICPFCFAAQKPGSTNCKFCGGVFPSQQREVEHVEGELVEVDTETLRQKRKEETYQAETYGELMAIAKARKYKRPHFWVKQVMNGRQRKKLGL